MRPKNILEVEIISKTAEVILQNRVDVKKSQLRQLTSVMEEIHKNWEGSFGGSIHTFLNQLLLKQMYSVRNKVVNAELNMPVHRVAINFYLTQKRSGKQFDVEYWELVFKRRGEAVTTECGPMLVYFFEQLMLLLNRQPLFKEYQKSKFIKNCYLLDYKFKLSVEDSCKEDLGHILQIPAKYQKVRTSQTLTIGLTCYYAPSLSMVCGKQPLLFSTEDKKNIPSKRRGSYLMEQEQINERKTSVYTFYDDELDITFISSDNEAFKNNQQTQVQKIQITDSLEEESEEFELLFIGEDQNFVQNNKEVLFKMKEHQEKYFALNN